MSCPYFWPREPMGDGPWERPPRMPLGETFRGDCRATPNAPFEPPEQAQREVCNCGYARGSCTHFPEDASFDAVRLSVREDEGGIVRIVYVMEKDHAPAAHGVMTYADHEPPQANEILAQQARVFVADYRRRRESRKKAAVVGMLY